MGKLVVFGNGVDDADEGLLAAGQEERNSHLAVAERIGGFHFEPGTVEAVVVKC